MNASLGQRVKELREGQHVVLTKVEAGGSLEARKLKSGVMFYWRHTRENATERLPIGTYDSIAPPKSLKPTSRGYSIAAALEQARSLARQDLDAPGGIRAARESERAAAAAAALSKEIQTKQTFGNLMLEYCDWLERQGKDSHREARTIFKNHLQIACPELWAAPAASLDRRKVNEPVRRLAEAGKKPTARKLRSYMHAAYVCAVRADSDANLPAAFLQYGVTSNPVEATAAVRGGGRQKNPLSLADLRTYWKALKDEPGVVGAALRFHLLSGAQRIAQLARLEPHDVQSHAIRLWDKKGRREEPRLHLVPLTSPMKKELRLLSQTGFALSTDGGHTKMHPTSISAWASEVGKRAKIEGFQLKRVRSAVETELARRGVAKDDRGHLQSHGLGGVQDRHYDAYEYLREKGAALEILHQLLEGTATGGQRRPAAA